ncbi:MAG: tRNA adenosine(34) deaminase TadA [Clostridia bacterium]|nr:tRNA adenosine(34) deaminase TadA [Clostridia bacterium]
MEEFFMKEALKEAQKAYCRKEVPIGAVVVYKNKIIGRGYNLREKKKSALMHAEIVAISKACKKLKSWRLEDCELYVTLEPCPMCAGAIIQSRIKKVFFGAFDAKAGCAGSTFDLFEKGKFNHDVEVTGGVLQEDCAALLKTFFKELRKFDKS